MLHGFADTQFLQKNQHTEGKIKVMRKRNTWRWGKDISK